VYGTRVSIGYETVDPDGNCSPLSETLDDATSSRTLYNESLVNLVVESGSTRHTSVLWGAADCDLKSVLFALLKTGVADSSRELCCGDMKRCSDVQRGAIGSVDDGATGR